MRASQDAHPIIRGTFVIDEKIEKPALVCCHEKTSLFGRSPFLLRSHRGRMRVHYVVVRISSRDLDFCVGRIAVLPAAATSIAPRAREPIPHALGAFLCFPRRPYEPPSPRRRGEMEAKDKTLPEWSLWPRFLHLATGRGGMRPRRPVRSLGLPPPTCKEGGAHPSNHVEVVPLDAPLAVRD